MLLSVELVHLTVPQYSTNSQVWNENRQFTRKYKWTASMGNDDITLTKDF